MRRGVAHAAQLLTLAGKKPARKSLILKMSTGTTVAALLTMIFGGAARLLAQAAEPYVATDLAVP
jgi:hypothetical protein